MSRKRPGLSRSPGARRRRPSVIIAEQSSGGFVQINSNAIRALATFIIDENDNFIDGDEDCLDQPGRACASRA